MKLLRDYRAFNFENWFLGHTERWLVPAVGYMLGGYVLYIVLEPLSRLEWSTISRAVFG